MYHMKGNGIDIVTDGHKTFQSHTYTHTLYIFIQNIDYFESYSYTYNKYMLQYTMGSIYYVLFTDISLHVSLLRIITNWIENINIS